MIKNKFKNKNQLGFTLIEVIVSVAILSILAGAVFGVYNLIIKQTALYRDKTSVSYLASQYIEIARNLPYSKIGTIKGNPNGELPDLPNALTLNFGGNDYKIYYAVSYIDDPADGTIMQGNDFAPTDYKQIKLYITNINTGVTNSFFTNIVPKGLEETINGGALKITVIDAIGQPIEGALIQIINNQTIPTFNLNRTSDSGGVWVEVGLPESINGYEIIVTKQGYSIDKTYSITQENPNPIKAHSTILVGQVTEISFSIDKLSSLNFLTLNQVCSPISNISMGIRGSKLIGIPNVLKFEENYLSNQSGLVSINNIEWDNYTPGIQEGEYIIYGTFPIQQVNLFPDTHQDFRIILGPYTENSLLVVVKDGSTGNVIEGANVNLASSIKSFNQTKITGGSVWSQQDWSGGSGQINFIDTSRYFQDNNITNNINPIALRLLKIGEEYFPSGFLESSSYDTGTQETIYTTIYWEPTSQDLDVNIKFQIATNNDNDTWDYFGPDGTDSTYYEVPGTAINSKHNQDRYIRYKVFLSTNNVNITPVLTSVNLNYVSGCNTPGQVIFTNLQESTDYNIEVIMNGYQIYQSEQINIDGRKLIEILMSE